MRDKYKILLGYFHTSFSVMDGMEEEKKISKDTPHLNNINKLNLTDICGTLYSTTAEYIFFS